MAGSSELITQHPALRMTSLHSLPHTVVERAPPNTYAVTVTVTPRFSGPCARTLSTPPTR
ncbi:hypothetical protein AR457_27295 [Streptomyces agglomeratus]|uniref:Uncharacterized protein n=1 Tax=Streptomyces agglomeratus TaxID=285458 RepID=A0A1E5PDL6_9ACTN|nr:hypothetical protein AS594_27165 [Streptomyces agglomeratus]OEJ38324.1 hypothetical protein BGK70_09360 [Streptomyces agglomeratus]OEJ47292.1 hypothetical protein AR457_27295 [Streptomyces agglomeratus]OEJ50852.1 hypothetical protein BGK72_08845 [Streptomyces agglomeratus]OEJ58215.1 hypothetical protein BGM19_09710 [Streptomyces agglomeratus]